MMDRTALLLRASEVRRRIFASLPWEIRYAAVFTRIAIETGYLHNWGRGLGAEFLLAGVTGMPDPGPHWNPKAPQPANTLPSGYLAKEMGDVYHLLLSKKFDPLTAKDAIDFWIAKVHGGHVKIDKEKAKSGLSSAMSYAKQGILFEANDLRRKAPGGITGIPKQDRKEKGVGQLESLEDVGDESKTLRRELEDPAALAGFRRLLSDRMWKEWMAYLAKHIHPDFPLYLSLSDEGYSDKEIVGWPNKGVPSKLPHWTQGGPQNWSQNYLPKLIPMSEAFFKSKGENLYDLV